MFPCDPLLLLLMVVLIVMIALIVRELAVTNGWLEGPRMFSGAYGGCTACGGEEEGSSGKSSLDISGALE